MQEEFVERRKEMLDLCALHSQQLGELHQAIYGNGNPEKGLVWIAKENRVMIMDLQDFVLQFKKNAWKIGWFLFTAGVAAMGSFVVSLIKLIYAH